jgi:hypothetical protein
MCWFSRDWDSLLCRSLFSVEIAMIFHRFLPSNAFGVAKGSSGICILRLGTSSVGGGGTWTNLVARNLF